MLMDNKFYWFLSDTFSWYLHFADALRSPIYNHDTFSYHGFTGKQVNNYDHTEISGRLSWSNANDEGAARIYPLHWHCRPPRRNQAQRQLRDQASPWKRFYHHGSFRLHHPDRQRYGDCRPHLQPPQDAHRLFTAIGVSPEIARTDACKVEHDISEETFKAMSRYNEILKETQNKAAAESWDKNVLLSAWP